MTQIQFQMTTWKNYDASWGNSALTTSDAFLAKVQRTAAVPDSTVPGDQAVDLFAYADEEIQGRLLPLVMSNRDEFFVAVKDFSLAANCARYQIPARAIGGKLRDVLYVSGQNVISLIRLAPEDVETYANQSPGSPSAFYLENASIVVVPAPSASTGTLRVKYFTRPGSLIATAGALVSTAVSVAGGIANVTVLAAADQAYDVISSYSPFPLMAADTVQNIVATGTHYTFNFAGETGFFANSQVNYLCNPGKSPVVQLPDELIATLVQRTAARYLEAKGFMGQAGVCEQRAEQLEKAAMVLLAPRVDGEPKRVTGGVLFRNRNSAGWWR